MGQQQTRHRIQIDTSDLDLLALPLLGTQVDNTREHIFNFGDMRHSPWNQAETNNAHGERRVVLVGLCLSGCWGKLDC